MPAWNEKPPVVVGSSLGPSSIPPSPHGGSASGLNEESEDDIEPSPRRLDPPGLLANANGSANPSSDWESREDAPKESAPALGVASSARAISARSYAESDLP